MESSAKPYPHRSLRLESNASPHDSSRIPLDTAAIPLGPELLFHNCLFLLKPCHKPSSKRSDLIREAVMADYGLPHKCFISSRSLRKHDTRIWIDQGTLIIRRLVEHIPGVPVTEFRYSPNFNLPINDKELMFTPPQKRPKPSNATHSNAVPQVGLELTKGRGKLPAW